MDRFQIIMDDTRLKLLSVAGKRDMIWLDSLIIPVYVAAVSALALVLHIIFLSKPARKLYARLRPAKAAYLDDPDADHSPAFHPMGFFEEVKEHVRAHGGLNIFAYKLVRLTGCLALLGLSLTTLILEEEDIIDINGLRTTRGKHWGKKPRKGHSREGFSQSEWLQVAMCTTYAYASLLALVSVSTRSRWGKVVTSHLALLLVATWGVLVYRDIWPLATFSQVPMDLREGWFLWSKVIVLTLVAVAVPLFIPRQYVPFDPAEPMEPNLEQTTPIISLLLWTFLDSLIFLAYRVPHLSHSMLPPLADYDRAKNLVHKSFPHLDPFANGKRPYLFWGLMRVFRKEYIALAFMMLIKVLASFASPLGINRLLYYLENRGEGAVVRPWVWVIWLFLGPVVGSIAMQWYIYLTTRTLVRTEAILTQLIFQHSLRIRMKAELPESTPSTVSTPATTPDSASVGETSLEDNSSGSGEETLQASSASLTSSSSKGKQKLKEAKPVDEPATADKKDTVNADNLIGKINNLVSTDLTNIVEARDFLMVVIYTPLQIILCVWFLYAFLGWSSFVGLAVIILLFPIPGYVAKLIQGVQVERMKKMDSRVQTVTETMNVIRMIKLFGWETKMNAKIAEKREEELNWLWKRQILDLLNGNLNFLIPVATMITTYATYTVIMKRDLSASVVFSSMAVFDVFRDQLHGVFYLIPAIVQGKVSVDRIDEFLTQTELLDSFAQKANQEAVESITENSEFEQHKIGFRNAVFSWSNDSQGVMTPSKRKFTLRIEDELLFVRGSINLIIGSTGSGKTSLLMALLGELHFIPSGPSSWYNLPRTGGVAYAAQESWVQNETIRENILFGAPYDEARYNKVIYQCGLQRDLTLFDAGDQTEVGEKGLTLSGGQKARITLARAVYSSAEILLLDDVLAALDVHTSKWIVDNCFSGDLIRGRTVLLVTHNVAMASPIAQFVVSLGLDGRILSQGSVADALAKDHALEIEVAKDQEATEKAEEEVDSIEPEGEVKKEADGKLTVAEEVAVGHVSWPAFKLYTSAVGGTHSFLFWVAFLGGMLLCDLANTLQTWFLGYWASQYEEHPSSEVAVSYYLTVYGLLLLAATIIYSSSYTLYVYGALRASRTIHKKLVESVLGTTLRWLDTTPTSRIITRATVDIRAVDGPISQGLSWLSELALTLLIKLMAVVLFTPIFIFPGIAIALLGGWCGQIYIKAQLSVKREMSNAKAPVLGHFGAAIAGLTSIRAYGAEHAVRQESLARIDRYTRAGRTFYNLNRWICVRVDALGGLFAAGLAAYLVYGPGGVGASDTGFSLNMAVGFSSMILWFIRIANDFEVSGNSLERIQGYVTIEQEPKASHDGTPPAYWPASGDILVENLSARYSPDGPKVLHDLSFHIKSGERIGVVGRTGSGKSSLTLSILRCIFTEGVVYYDGIPTSSINLDALRSNITIIPQIPELLSGTLRQNLDPFAQYDDATLNDALRASGLRSLQSEDDDGSITLDSAISSGGGNLSVGQRQILALARAIVRGSKLLILDEATSAIDFETDSIIQTSLRNELGGDVTILTVAHRLQTIMDADKIMVLDAGRLIEFDRPSELLKNEKSMLRALVDESGDRDTLYAMATGGSR